MTAEGGTGYKGLAEAFTQQTESSAESRCNLCAGRSFEVAPASEWAAERRR